VRGLLHPYVSDDPGRRDDQDLAGQTGRDQVDDCRQRTHGLAQASIQKHQAFFYGLDEIDGLEWFEVLQKQRDEITLSIYTEYQSAEYVALMDDYNKNRKLLRTQLAKKQITWRQFVDDLQVLIQKMQAQEKLFWEKNPTIERAMV
jgi:hypothetical protein